MRRILALHPSDELYGADRVLLDAVDVLARRGQVTVWLADDLPYPGRPLSARLAEEGVRVLRRPIPVLRRAHLRPRAVPALLRRCWRTVRALRRERPAVVYLSTSATLLAGPLARLAGARVVLHLHETWQGPERHLLRLLARSCHRVVAVSVAAARATGLKDVRVVHNGVDLAPSATPERRSELRARAGAGEGEILAVVASRWNDWKGHPTLLAAWAGLRREDLRLVVLGGPPPTGGVDVPGLAARLRGVHVLGEVPEVREWFEAADLVLVPSTRPEPFGLVAVEAAALARPVLASRTGGLTETVVDGRTGLLLPPGDVEAWREALEGLDAGWLRQAGEAARLRYEERFTRGRFARDLARATKGV